jgi:hypothetical protein
LKTITDADGTLKHVKHLAVHIGSRLIGSTANLAAADYISEVFKQGALSLEKQEFSCPDWVDEHTSLKLNGTPNIALSSKGIRDIYHTTCDTFEWISGEKLAEVLQLALDLIDVFDNKDLSWSRPKN